METVITFKVKGEDNPQRFVVGEGSYFSIHIDRWTILLKLDKHDSADKLTVAFNRAEVLWYKVAKQEAAKVALPS